VPIHEEVEDRISGSVSIATVYSALERLGKDGVVTSRLSAPSRKGADEPSGSTGFPGRGNEKGPTRSRGRRVLGVPNPPSPSPAS
jgi:hypothetical protein